MTDPYPFLNDAPEGFERTNDIRWIAAGAPSEPTPAVLSYRYEVFDGSDHHNFDPPVYVLCQKWQGAFRSCWVRVPIQEP